MINKKGVSLVVLVITIVVIIILVAAVVLNLSGSNPIDSSRVSRICTNYDNLTTDIKLYISKAHMETKSYFNDEEILFGTGSVRKGVNLSQVENVGTNSDGTWNASGYRIVSKSGSDYVSSTITLNNGSTVEVYQIDKAQYEKLANAIPATTTAGSEWCIDKQGNVYLVYNNLSDVQKWLRGKVKGNTITDNSTLAKFLGVKNLDGDDSESSSSAITPANVTKNYYGKVVSNYNAQGVEWKVFHSDGQNIYLITSEYIPYDKIPKVDSVALNKGDYDNAAYFTNVLSSYSTGSGAITADNPARKWLKSYFDYLSTNSTTSGSNENMQAIAYMLDTNKWSDFADSTYADYAIGGPTVEMLFASYNKKYTDVNYQARVPNKNGYQISQNGGSSWDTEYHPNIFDVSDNLYVLAATIDKDGNGKVEIQDARLQYGASSFWVASPSAYGSKYVMRVGCDGACGGNNNYDDKHLRI